MVGDTAFQVGHFAYVCRDEARDRGVYDDAWLVSHSQFLVELARA